MQLVIRPALDPTGIVIPCYNESERLNCEAVQTFLRLTHGVTLLFVDDGSRDGTARMLAELAAASPGRVQAWRLERNCGKAEAVRRGMLLAAALGFDQVGFWDADLATPLEAIPAFVQVLQRLPAVQAVWGTRLPLLGHHICREPKRRLLGRLFSSAAALAVNVPIRDALCGAKLFRNTPLLEALLSQPFGSRWIFDVEILSRIKRLLGQFQHHPVTEALFEFPLEEWYEIPGSKVQIRDFVRAFFELTSLAWQHRFTAPLAHRLPIGVHDEVALLEIAAHRTEDERPTGTLRKAA